jgi:hypothetical protein
MINTDSREIGPFRIEAPQADWMTCTTDSAASAGR